MVKMLLVGLVFGLLLVGGVLFMQEYSIPQLIPVDYNCEEHPGFISDRNPFPFESPQHYINRHAGAVKTQIEEICGV